jgi:hypothetical protein
MRISDYHNEEGYMESNFHLRYAIHNIKETNQTYFEPRKKTDNMPYTVHVLRESLRKQIYLEVTDYIDSLNQNQISTLDLIKTASKKIGKVNDLIFVFNNLIEGIKSGGNFGRLIKTFQNEGLLKNFSEYEDDEDLIGDLNHACDDYIQKEKFESQFNELRHHFQPCLDYCLDKINEEKSSIEKDQPKDFKIDPTAMESHKSLKEPTTIPTRPYNGIFLRKLQKGLYKILNILYSLLSGLIRTLGDMVKIKPIIGVAGGLVPTLSFELDVESVSSLELYELMRNAIYEI